MKNRFSSLFKSPNLLHGITILFLTLVMQSSHGQEQLVQYAGSSFNVYLNGFKDRRVNQPVIVLENGMGPGLDHWTPAIGELALLAPVFAYDRRGTGKSEKSNVIPTVQSVASDLYGLLGVLKIDPPYILVGHSLGGVFIRAFAGFHPSEIAALVFIDPADFTETRNDWRSLLIDVGVHPQRADEMIHTRLYGETHPDSVNFGPWSEGQLLTLLRRNDFAELSALPVPSAPVYFFIGGKFEVPRERWSKDYDHPKFFERRTNANIERWKKFIDFSDKRGSLFYIASAGHYLHRDAPVEFLHHFKFIIDTVVK
jgi:pimeloyl-ACP methyl ester carboxylesterase